MKGNYNEIREGDALQQLKEIDDETIDLIVTDPPYGYSFMNKDWDKAVVSVEVWRECLRVLKAGAFAFIMSAPRQDVLSRMIVNLQDAGFRTDFTSIYYSYASGFPKASNTFKMLQKRDKAKPELNGSYLGFQPKPAVEVVLTVMKPLSEKSFVDQALNNGKGITWLDDCRIPFQNTENNGWMRSTHLTDIRCNNYMSPKGKIQLDSPQQSNDKGRFPANLLVSDDVLNGHSKYFDLDKWYDNNNRAQFIITPKASASERNGATHPTIKPIKLMSYLITMGSRKNDIVLDPFCGSGTTLIAAHLLNRRWIGIELNAEYAAIARKRTEPYLVQQKLI